MQVDEILRSKGAGVETIGPEESLRSAAHRMSSERIGCLAVLSEGGHLAGLITERDVVRAVSRLGPDASLCRVRSVMSTHVPTCTPQDDVRSLMRTMTERRYRHVPVMRNETVVGIVSIGDVVKRRLSELELETNVLRDVYLSTR